MTYTNLHRLIKPKITYSRFLPIILSSLIICLLILQVIVSNRLTTNGGKIKQTENEITQLQENNARLSQTIASSSALLVIKKRAAEQGFTKPIQVVYLSKDQPIALEGR